MINKTLFKYGIKSSYRLLLIFLAVLTIYSAMIVTMFDPRLGESLDLMAQSMPEIFAAFGMKDAGATLTEFISNYLYGFLFVALPLVLILILANRLVASPVDKGSMAHIISTPNRRSKIIFTQMSIMLLCTIAMVVYVTLLCIIICSLTFKGQLDIAAFLRLNAGLLGILIFLSGLCFACSCIFNSTKYALGIGSAACIAFLLIQMVSQVGDKFEWLKYCTPLTLFSPDKILAGDAFSAVSALILYVSGGIFYAVGAAVFCKKDLPL